MTDDGALRTAVAEDFPPLRRDLERLVAIPSVSAPGHAGDALPACADAVGAVLAAAGFTGLRHLEVPGAPPYVYGELEGARADAPTVLLYAHYDVQPAGEEGRWTSPPFVPTERDGRLYGRGAADNKAAVVLHAAAARAWLRTAGAPPVHVKVLVEGEEEIGSPNLHAFLDAAAPLLRADVVVLPDAAAWDTGWPALTWSLRGLAELTVTLRSLRRPLHSGVWGGAAPDAIAAMARLVASLHDAEGRLTVAGARDGVVEDARARELVAALAEDDLEEHAGLVPGARWVGDPGESVFEKVWLRPSVTVVGLDAPPVRDASNQLVGEVRAKLSLRSAPGQDPEAVVNAVAGHLREHVPWGATLDIREGPRCPAWITRPDGPAVAAAQRALERAYGRRPALVGGGGTIPFVGGFSEALGGVPCLLPGLGDPYMNAHAQDESMHLGDLRKAFLAEALLLGELAEHAGELRRGRHDTS